MKEFIIFYLCMCLITLCKYNSARRDCGKGPLDDEDFLIMFAWPVIVFVAVFLASRAKFRRWIKKC